VSRVAFPVKAAAHSQDDTQTLGVFDARGYWASFGFGSFELPSTLKNTDRISMVVRMMNAAYNQGQEDAQRAIREALGIET
jgi:hypothetical protein